MGWHVLGVRGVGCATVGGGGSSTIGSSGGQSDANIPFEQTVNMLEPSLGFDERISGKPPHLHQGGYRGGSLIFQSVGGECKPYQVRQVRTVLRKYNLR